MDPYNTADAHGAPAGNPHAVPPARPAQYVGMDAGFVKSSRGARLGAVLLDSVPVFAIAMIAAIAMPSMAKGSDSTAGLMLVGAIMVVGVLGFIAYQLVQLYRTGQTFGKKLVGIRIVRTDGSRAGLRRIFALRYLVPGLIGAIPLLGAIFSLIDPLFIFNDEKRCLHDMIADTIVVDA